MERNNVNETVARYVVKKHPHNSIVNIDEAILSLAITCLSSKLLEFTFCL